MEIGGYGENGNGGYGENGGRRLRRERGRRLRRERGRRLRRQRRIISHRGTEERSWVFLNWQRPRQTRISAGHPHRASGFSDSRFFESRRVRSLNLRCSVPLWLIILCSLRHLCFRALWNLCFRSLPNLCFRSLPNLYPPFSPSAPVSHGIRPGERSIASRSCCFTSSEAMKRLSGNFRYCSISA